MKTTAPAVFSMDLFIVNDETSEVGKVNIRIGYFDFPSKEQIAKEVDKFIAEGFIGPLAGFRPITDEEFWHGLDVMIDDGPT